MCGKRNHAQYVLIKGVKIMTGVFNDVIEQAYKDTLRKMIMRDVVLMLDLHNSFSQFHLAAVARDVIMEKKMKFPRVILYRYRVWRRRKQKRKESK